MKNKRFTLSLRRREMLTGYLFVSFWAIGFLVFFVANLAQTVRYSFGEISFGGEGGGYTFIPVGLENYIEIFTRHGFHNRLLVESLGRMLIDVPLIVIFSLMMALLLNRKFKMRGLLRAVFFLPVIMSTGAVSQALDTALGAIFGGVTNLPDRAVQHVGTTGIDIMFIMRTLTQYGIPVDIIEYLIAAAARVYSIIRDSGVQILIFLAALQSIPTSLYEVAKTEGATAYESFWKITFPMVSPLILTNVIYTIVDIYSKSGIVNLAYDTAFRHFNLGLGAAMSLASSVAASIILLAVGYLISRKVFYQN